MTMEEEVPTSASPGGRRHIVVFADDEPAILLALERALRNEPYDLQMTTDPEKALEWIKARGVSVVIADYRMPIMCGMTLLEETRAASPRTARILLTAYPGETEVLKARETGLITLFGKPWDEKELKRTIRDRVREREILEGV